MAPAVLCVRIRHRRVIAGVLALAVLLMTVALPVCAQDPIDIDRLEMLLYGRTYTGTYLDRLNRLEKDLYGSQQSGAIPVRTLDIDFKLSDRSSAESLWLQFRAVEWKSGQAVNETYIMDRLSDMELFVYGEVKSGPVLSRVDELVRLWFIGGKIPFRTADVPARTPVDLKLEQEVSSETAKAGQVVKLSVVNNVIVDGVLVIPRGATGELLVTEAEAGTHAFKRAKLNVQLKNVKAIDGTLLAIEPADPEADLTGGSANQDAKTQLAVGASILGMILLPPLGAAAGLLVRADQLVLPQGTVIRAVISTHSPVLGVEVVPSVR